MQKVLLHQTHFELSTNQGSEHFLCSECKWPVVQCLEFSAESVTLATPVIPCK